MWFDLPKEAGGVGFLIEMRVPRRLRVMYGIPKELPGSRDGADSGLSGLVSVCPIGLLCLFLRLVPGGFWSVGSALRA